MGCGIDISNLAPIGAKVNNCAKETTGSISFMDLYNLTTGLIGQNGRRGALMISLDVSHPDVEDFITLKSDLNKITKANISIKITDDFMQAVKEDKDWVLFFERPETKERIEKTVKAKDLFKSLSKMNWDYAEPGALFWDRITNWSLLSEDKNFKYAGVNPCAEEPLPAGGSCLLGSINLAEFVIDPFTDEAIFDTASFGYAVKQAVVALNEVLHEGLPLHPLQEQRDSVNDWRQIGLGLFGWHDCLIKLGIKYGSKESIGLAKDVGKFLINCALQASANLTDIYGTYPKYNAEAILNSPFLKENAYKEIRGIIAKKGLANSQLLTIPPTGSTATMLGVSTALEPIYNISYTRKTESLHGKEEYYKVYTPIVEQYMKVNSITIEEDLPDYFITAMTLNYKDRIATQGVWQKYIDASISSTVNVPESFTVEDTENLYMLAWENGLKGVTLFRDNCKRIGILTNTSTEDKKEEIKTEIESKTINSCYDLPWGYTIEANDDLIGRKTKIMSGCGSLHLQAWFDADSGKLMEIFLSKGSQGGCNSFMIGLSRMISAGLRTGLDIDYAIDQLNSVPACPSYVSRTVIKKDTSKGQSCPNAIGFALQKMQKEVYEELGTIDTEDETFSESKTETLTVSKKKHPCPECGEELAFEGGCNSCKNCGYSRCE